MTSIRILRAGPLTTLQDAGRPGLLRHGISASGPMDRASSDRAGVWLGEAAPTGIEFTTAGLSFTLETGALGLAWDGGAFTITIDGSPNPWPGRALLKPGSTVDITPGPAGNYGYLRFDAEPKVPAVMGSTATSSIAGIGGYAGRALATGDILAFGPSVARRPSAHPHPAEPSAASPIRIIWGTHADIFTADTRQHFVTESFAITPQLDRMGVRLADPAGAFANQRILSLVSDAVVPGDIQILGDGTPIVLMRDHQPTGGYPRIATIVSADLDRFAQFRPGTELRFEPVTVAHARALSGKVADFSGSKARPELRTLK
ncbi:MAG: biotin-dependent carboxyltransferase family protein [Devosia sp.]